MVGRLGHGGRIALVLASLTSCGFALGCRRAPGLPDPKGGSPRARSPEPDAAPLAPSASPRVGITWVDPPGLERSPPTSPTQRARYIVPRATGDTEDGELAVFHLGPEQRGDIDPTLDRWVKQFSGVAPGDVTRAVREANGLRLHTVEVRHGTLDARRGSPASSGSKKDYALEGAIVEGPSGAYLFELTGPAHTIAAGRPAFMRLLDSVHVVRADH